MQRDLVERARRGDHDAFAELAAAAISRLDTAAWLILRDVEQAKDAVQNALVRACIDEARRLRWHRVDVELTTIHHPAVTGLESVIADRDELERGVLRLDPEMRAVIVLHHYFDLPLPSVATVLGIPLGTAKSRLHRALGLMRAALDADARARPYLGVGRS